MGFEFCAQRKEGNAYRTFFRWFERRRQLRTPSCKGNNNIKIYLNRKGCEIVDWIHLSLVRIRWRANENRNESLVYITRREFIDKLRPY